MSPSRVSVPDFVVLAAGGLAIMLLLTAAAALGVRADGDERRLVTAGGVGATTSASGEPDTDSPGPAGGLLPNMIVLPANELAIEGSGNDRLLRFASVLANDGIGPIQITPDPDRPCPPRERYVAQTVFLDGNGDGVYQRRIDTGSTRLEAGCMVFHPTHEHWHFDGSAAYTLTEIDSEEPIVSRKKVSFCLRDSEVLPGATDRRPAFYAECARDRRQGITVGWADRYDASLHGQTLALPNGFRNGRYCLRLQVDPFELLTEVDETDNTSAIVVRIRGSSIQRIRAATC